MKSRSRIFGCFRMAWSQSALPQRGKQVSLFRCRVKGLKRLKKIDTTGTHTDKTQTLCSCNYRALKRDANGRLRQATAFQSFCAMFSQIFLGMAEGNAFYGTPWRRSSSWAHLSRRTKATMRWSKPSSSVLSSLSRPRRKPLGRNWLGGLRIVSFLPRRLSCGASIWTLCQRTVWADKL